MHVINCSQFPQFGKDFALFYLRANFCKHLIIMSCISTSCLIAVIEVKNKKNKMAWDSHLFVRKTLDEAQTHYGIRLRL